MVEENTKYIAEAWIEDGKEEDFKKSFLQSFVDQLQHHKVDGEGAGFDADTVDGMHYCQIIDVFDDKIKDFINTFSIGNVLFNQNQNNYFIGFDGVKLYIEDIDGYENYYTLPWIEDDMITPAPDLKGVFVSLYNKVIEIQGELDDKIENFATLLSEYEEASDIMNSHFIDGDLYADSINGLRFYLIHQSDYNALSSDEKNNPRHVYIIKDDDVDIPQDLLEETYNTAPISNLYEFRVNATDSYLQYRHEQEAEGVWHDIAPLSAFYDETAISNVLVNILGGDQDYPLRPNSVKNVLEQIPLDSINNWPNPKDTYVIGGYYGDKENNPILMEADYANQAGYKFINLNNIKTTIENEIISKANELTTSINQNADDIVALSANITNLKEGDDSPITKLSNDITNLRTSINNLNTKLSNIQNNWIHSTHWKNNGSDLYYNPDLKLAYFQSQLTVSYNPKNKGTWLNLSYTLPKKPKAGIRIITSPWTMMEFRIDGTVRYYTEYDKSTSSLSLVGAALYPYI